MGKLEALYGADFRSPPMESRPLAWWHWMNGNISENGIVKDLDWMARVGLGGVQNFDAALATPLIVDQRLAYMTPEWQRAFRLAVSHATKLGLEFGIAGSPGWSETGGPWVPPKDGMKKLVWTETLVSGGSEVEINLPPPPTTKGPYQDSAFVPHIVASEPANPIDDFYADACVLAYRRNGSALHLPSSVLDCGELVADPSALFDGSYRTALLIKRGSVEEPGFLDLCYDEPVRVRSVRIAVDANGRIYRKADLEAELLASEDGFQWKSLAHIEILKGVPTTVSFPETVARFYRVIFHPAEAENPRAEYSRAPGAVVPEVLPQNHPGIPVWEVSIMSEARVDYSEMKAGFGIAADYYALERDLPDYEPVRVEEVVNLTEYMSPDGRLSWTFPEGDWRVLRLGYSLTGTLNHPATSEATGLEVDKYDSKAVKSYIDRYLANFRDVLGDKLAGAGGLRSIIVDSIETGLANWTSNLVPHFSRLRGYDPTPWLPSLTGIIINSRSATDQFLYDFRRTLADLLATEHYKTVAEAAQSCGLTVYGEATEVSRPVLGDDMAMRRYTNVPMSAMWTFHHNKKPRPTLVADIKGAASVSHVYGQNLAAAESLTAAYSPWAFAPWDLKLAIDLEFAMGINRPVLHSSVHQPSDKAIPGLSLSIFGQYFNRHDTWAELARPWIDYIARCSHLLRLGRSHADVAYFYGEEAPLTALFEGDFAPDAPKTADFDFINADVVLNLLQVEKGKLTTPSGCQYHVLYLGGTAHRMTLAVLRRIAELADAGAVIVGRPPCSSPSLADDIGAFEELKERLWQGQRENRCGLGRVFDDDRVDHVLADLGVVPDVSDENGAAVDDLMFLHRVTEDGHFYFLSNRQDGHRDLKVAFGVSGEAVEAWDAATGEVYSLPFAAKGTSTVVDISLAARGSLFIAISQDNARCATSQHQTFMQDTMRVEGNWRVLFQEGRGAPAEAMLAEGSLSEHPEFGIRHFSGVATYLKQIEVPRISADCEVWLDLGFVGDLAEIYVNGVFAGSVWKAPWAINLTGLLCEGANTLGIRIANVWVNRLIGDAQPGVNPITFTTLQTYHADAPLRPSGLVGPVRMNFRRPVPDVG